MFARKEKGEITDADIARKVGATSGKDYSQKIHEYLGEPMTMSDKDILKIEIGERIKNIRMNKMHMSKSAFAKLIGMKSQYLGTVESGQRGLTIETALKICNKTNITCDYLLRGIDNSIKDSAKDILSKYSNEDIYNAFELLKDLTLLLK